MSEQLASPEQRVWHETLLQAYRDACGTDERERSDVARWLASDDFERVCAWANVGLTATWRRRFEDALANPQAARAALRATWRELARRKSSGGLLDAA